MIGNNVQCPCGSGRKFKRCCRNEGMSNNAPKPVQVDPAEFERRLRRSMAPALLIIAGIAASSLRR